MDERRIIDVGSIPFSRYGAYAAIAWDKAKGEITIQNALTGQGLCAPGYTWTASVYMLLVWEYGL